MGQEPASFVGEFFRLEPVLARSVAASPAIPISAATTNVTFITCPARSWQSFWNAIRADSP